MILTVQIKPNAKKSQVRAWVHPNRVIIDVAAPAVDGKANEALISLLSKQLHVTKSQINIKRGLTSRVKHIELPEGTNLSELQG